MHSADITPSGGSFSMTLQPGFVYSLTTTTGQGKGTATSPAPASLALPYTDSFDSDTAGQQPRYLAQQLGAFEVGPCAGGRTGQCVLQQAPVKPIEWDPDSNPYTIGGNTGAWSIVRNNTSDTLTTLASGTVAAPGLGSWQHLALTFSGSTISAAINGSTVGTVTDTTYPSGMVGLGTSGYQTDQFDKLSVTPVAGSVSGPIVAGVNTGKCVDDNADSSANGTKVQMWDCNGGASQDWTFPGNGTIGLNGKCMDITGAGTANGTQLDIWTCNGGSNQQWKIP